jgi:hypothetical protein
MPATMITTMHTCSPLLTSLSGLKNPDVDIVTLEEHLAIVLKSAGGVAFDDKHHSEAATEEIRRQRAKSNGSVQLARILEELGRGNFGSDFARMETSSSNRQGFFLRLTGYKYACHNCTPRADRVH